VSPGVAGPWGLVPARDVRVVSGQGPAGSTMIVLALTTELPSGVQLIDDNTGTEAGAAGTEAGVGAGVGAGAGAGSVPPTSGAGWVTIGAGDTG